MSAAEDQRTEDQRTEDEAAGPAVRMPRDGAPAAGGGLDTIETPSGKGHRDENFPVGSFLLPPRLRPHVAVYYAFARGADDIADNPGASASEKIARLDAFESALLGHEETLDDPRLITPRRLRVSLRELGVSLRRGQDLLAAFRQDAVKTRYDTWDELMGYCRNSANPVGRYLLDIHGEDPCGYEASDALCTVLQVLNHLQDCGDDLREMDRCYVPRDWLAEEGETVDALRASAMSPGLTRVKQRMLDGCEAMMPRVRDLPGLLRHRSLRMETAVICHLARRLLERLRKGDPLAARVKLTKADFAICGLTGAARGFFGGGK